MSEPIPLIVLVHGAWQRPSQYNGFKKGLVSRGFEVLQPSNISSGSVVSEIEGKTHLDDVAVIHEAIAEPLAQGREIILVCHSYGGIPASAAAEGFQVHERKAKNLPGGIKHIVYLAAFALPQPGLSLFNLMGNAFPDWVHPKGGAVGLNAKAKDALFNDCDDETAERLLAQCVFQSAASIETSSGFVGANVKVPKTYVACETDHALPFDAQLGLAEALGSDTNVVRVRSGTVCTGILKLFLLSTEPSKKLHVLNHEA